jgi:PPM family protein phosphatase
LHICCGSRSDQGRVRSSNEDSYVANAKAKIFVVADGMGGHAAGEIASRLAAAAVEEVVIGYAGSGLSPEEILRMAVEEANRRVYHGQHDKSDLAGMGSTLTSLSFCDDEYYTAHVGDSRAYLLRDGVLSQLTRDHSLVWHLFESGILQKRELSNHPQKNLITRSIGPHPEVEVEIGHGEVHAGDIYLLCSDGLTDMLCDEAIHEILSGRERTPQQMSESLVKTANERGGPDNITVVVVRIEPGEPEEEGASG